MKIYRDDNLECLIIDDDVEAYICEETGEVLNMFSRTSAEFDSDEIQEEVFDFQQAESERLTFRSNIWTRVDKNWKF